VTLPSVHSEDSLTGHGRAGGETAKEVEEKEREVVKLLGGGLEVVL